MHRVSWMLVRLSFLSSAFSRIDSEIPNFDEEMSSLLVLAAQHKIHRPSLSRSGSLHSKSRSVLVLTWHQSQCALYPDRQKENHCEVATRRHREIHNIEQTKKVIPTIFFEKLPLVRMSASWFLVSTYLIWISGFRMDSVK